MSAPCRSAPWRLFGYCFLKGKPYSNAEVESPGILFDYVLLLGCSLYAADVGYIETQFHVLGDFWHNYLLVSAALFFFLAYRFDNRLVLSMALSTLAAWFGFQLSVRFLSFQNYYRESAIAYSLITFAAGSLSHRLAVKKHFFDIYLNFTVHFLLAGAPDGRCRVPVLILASARHGHIDCGRGGLFHAYPAVSLHALCNSIRLCVPECGSP